MNKFIIILKHIGFYLFQLTWGLPLTLIGLVGAIFMLLTFHKPKKVGYFIQFTARNDYNGWGFEGGIFYFTSTDCENDISLITHEMGHCSYQQLWFGPFAVLIVTIPSLIRFWYREFLYRFKPEKAKKLPPYDSIWFEGTATKYGMKFYEKMVREGIVKIQHGKGE